MDVWPYEGSFKMLAALEQLDTAMARFDPLAALMAISRLAELMPDVAADLCAIASRAGFTNKRIATALDVSPATLRGLKEKARLT